MAPPPADLDAPLVGATATLLQALPDAVLVLDTVGSVLWGNRAAERLFGRDLAESIGLSAIELLHPDDLALARRSLASVQGKQIGSPIELRVPGPTGWRLVEVLGSPVDWLGERAVLFSIRDLTERRRFEVAHHEDARFRSLLQNAGALVVLVSETGLIESISGAVSRLLGHDPELLEHRPLFELVDVPDRPALAQAFGDAGEPGGQRRVNVSLSLLRYASSETVLFDLSIVNLLDDPTVGGYVVTGHDISARSSSERELRETLSLLQATLDAVADGIVLVDQEGGIAGFNRPFAEMLCLPEALRPEEEDPATAGYVLDQLTGASSLVPEPSVPSDRSAAGAEILEMPDGRIFERRSRPQRVGGAVAGHVWSFREVTESRRLLEELREREQQFRLLFDQSPLGVAVVDLGSRVIEANPAIAEFLGRPREELVGRTLASFMPAEDTAKLVEMAQALSDGSIASYQQETHFIRPDGSIATANVTGSVVYNDTHTPVYGLRIVEDLTRRRFFEHELVEHAHTARQLLNRLSARETEVLQLLATVDSAPQLAKELCVSVRTVESHLSSAYRKLGVRSRAAAKSEFDRLSRAAVGLGGLPLGSVPGT